MQAIETDISHDGHIRLSESLHTVFGRHARLILLLDDTKPLQTTASSAISAFRGSGKGGATARDEATGDSDIDILVEFKGHANSDSYFGLQFFLEDHLGVRVDLVTEKALRKELRPFIEREAVNV
jgi:predicted nucleotidyltransferase